MFGKRERERLGNLFSDCSRRGGGNILLIVPGSTAYLLKRGFAEDESYLVCIKKAFGHPIVLKIEL